MRIVKKCMCIAAGITSAAVLGVAALILIKCCRNKNTDCHYLCDDSYDNQTENSSEN